MSKSKNEQTLPIAELLPEGLSESAIGEIATLVNTMKEMQFPISLKSRRSLKLRWRCLRKN